jgi:hypothetical protein
MDGVHAKCRIYRGVTRRKIGRRNQEGVTVGAVFWMNFELMIALGRFAFDRKRACPRV